MMYFAEVIDACADVHNFSPAAVPAESGAERAWRLSLSAWSKMHAPCHTERLLIRGNIGN